MADLLARQFQGEGYTGHPFVKPISRESRGGETGEVMPRKEPVESRARGEERDKAWEQAELDTWWAECSHQWRVKKR